jgi:hypothetical protein
MAFDDRPSPSDQGSSGSPARRKRWRIWAALAVCLVMAGLVVAAVRSYRASHRDDLSNARVGDCVAEVDDYTRDVPYDLAGCGESAAEYRVLAVEARKGGGGYCREVAGASLVLSADEKVLCLGKKDVDPTKAVNVAKEGDCLYLELPPRSAAGLEPVRLDCADPQANLKVLSRRTGQSKFDSESDWCQGVDGFVKAYGFSWSSLEPDPRVPDFTVDVVLCMGWLHPTAATPSWNPNDPNRPGSNCSYVTAEEMSATVSTAMGRTYTVKSRTINNGDCIYQFQNDREGVTTWTRGPGKTPAGSKDQEFTVDGFDARYAPGEGNRVLSVYLPNTTYIIYVHLNGAGDSLSKKVAMAVFAVARPRLS